MNREQARQYFNRLQAVERTTREAARHQFAHPDDHDFEERVANGVDSYPVIITQVGRWAITEYGLECLTELYHINANALFQDHWIEHMGGKNWVDDLEDFTAALYHARAIHSYLRKVKQQVSEE